MADKKSGLEGKLNASEPKVTMETNLREFSRIMWQDYKTSKNKTKEQGLRRAYSMLGYLYRGELPYGLSCRRGPIHTVGELYSFTEKDLLGLSCYQGKTWKSLSEHLAKYGLPKVKLPQEWTQQT
jgi:hypothetical protein